MNTEFVRYCGSNNEVYCPLIKSWCNPECICLQQVRIRQADEYRKYAYTYTCNQFSGARLWIDDGVKA